MPSAAIGINSRWIAWQFDSAINHFGTWMEYQLSLKGKDGKPLHTVEKLLKVPSKMRVRKISAADFEARGVKVTYVPASA